LVIRADTSIGAGEATAKAVENVISWVALAKPPSYDPFEIADGVCSRPVVDKMSRRLQQDKVIDEVVNFHARLVHLANQERGLSGAADCSMDR